MRTLLAGLSLFAAAAAAHAVPIATPSSWETTLQARDINHDGLIDAYYDTSTNLSWLADANYAGTSGFAPASMFTYPPNVEGAMNRDVAVGWAASLDIYGVKGWRLPRALSVAPVDCAHNQGRGIQTGLRCEFSPEPGINELVDLYHLLGGSKGPFLNAWLYGLPGYLMESNYTGPEAPGYNLDILTSGPTEIILHETFAGYAWAVRDGDVMAVPEPSTYGLMMLGITVLALRRRQNKTGRGLS
ncbi:MAG: PEP-CTERM sorting domain-containing protein [Burkholderiales bacterium]|jgi:hypothetical protein|nr:PEP-CTERM sorting domain-containing protein [Burkholderiales bacterium]